MALGALRILSGVGVVVLKLLGDTGTKVQILTVDNVQALNIALRNPLLQKWLLAILWRQVTRSSVKDLRRLF